MKMKVEITDKTGNVQLYDVSDSNLNWHLIKKGVILPDDFIIGGGLNRDKYIIEFGFSDRKKWFDEFSSPVTAEVLGAIIICSDAYNDFRWRLRTEYDEKWDLTKTTIGKIINAGR